MGLSLHFHSHIPDAIGSILIGGLLGSVASFMIYTNSGALVGRSIPEEKIRAINTQLEGDIMIRAIHDVKGTLNFGMDKILTYCKNPLSGEFSNTSRPLLHIVKANEQTELTSSST